MIKKLDVVQICDGGYVLAELDGDYDCYISAGINNEESFSRDFINKYKINKNNSYGFDGTINDYPYEFTTLYCTCNMVIIMDQYLIIFLMLLN